MEWIKEIKIDSPVQSTTAVMDWLKENNFPDCDYAYITCSNGQYGGIISSYTPNDFQLDCWEECQQYDSAEYHGMYRHMTYPGCWIFKCPGDKWYILTI